MENFSRLYYTIGWESIFNKLSENHLLEDETVFAAFNHLIGENLSLNFIKESQSYELTVSNSKREDGCWVPDGDDIAEVKLLFEEKGDAVDAINSTLNKQGLIISPLALFGGWIIAANSLVMDVSHVTSPLLFFSTKGKQFVEATYIDKNKFRISIGINKLKFQELALNAEKVVDVYTKSAVEMSEVRNIVELFMQQGFFNLPKK